MSRTGDWTNLPSKTCQQLRKKEKDFILDGVAVSTIGTGFEGMQPKLWSSLPPYNSQRDRFLADYFKKPGIKELLSRTEQHHGGSSIGGWVVDYFHIFGPGQKYINRRNWIGAGHSEQLLSGHSSFMSDVHPFDGYNGRFGFRRNTTALRNKPSPFGVNTRLPLH